MPQSRWPKTLRVKGEACHHIRLSNDVIVLPFSWFLPVKFDVNSFDVT